MWVKMNTIVKYWIIGVLCLFVFFVLPDMAHAQDTTSITEDIWEYMNMWIKLLSRIWVVPASIAGRLMTNDFTYGSVIHLDTYLRKIWTIMSTFAFYTLAIIFIALLAKHFIKNEGPSNLWSLLGKVALAGILIPASWFIIAAVIDISTVATSAVAAFPQEILKDQWNSMNVKITAQKVTNIQWLSADQLDNINVSEEKPLELIDILPSADNVAGPLVFMGAAILKLIDTNRISDDKWGSSASTWKQLTISSIIKIIALLMFIVPLVVLMVVNMIRIFRIRIWIIFSPFIVLDQIFKWPLQANDKMWKNFKISNILGLIFQPVAIVGLISLGLILLIGVRNALEWGGDYTKLEETLQVHSDDKSSTFWYNTNIAQVVVSGGFFEGLGSRVGGFVGETILLLFTIFLLWSLVKAWFSMSEITKWVAESIYKFSEWMIKTIPLPGTSLSRWSVGRGVDKVTKENMWMDRKVHAQAASLNKGVDRFFGLDTSNDIDNDEQEKIISAVRSGSWESGRTKNFWNEILSISKNKPITYTQSFKQALDVWFKDGQAIDYLVHNNVINAEEAKLTPAEIMTKPSFMSFIDHVLSNGCVLPLTWARNTSITTLDSKKRGGK